MVPIEWLPCIYSNAPMTPRTPGPTTDGLPTDPGGCSLLCKGAVLLAGMPASWLKHWQASWCSCVHEKFTQPCYPKSREWREVSGYSYSLSCYSSSHRVDEQIPNLSWCPFRTLRWHHLITCTITPSLWLCLWKHFLSINDIIHNSVWALFNEH